MLRAYDNTTKVKRKKLLAYKVNQIPTKCVNKVILNYKIGHNRRNICQNMQINALWS